MRAGSRTLLAGTTAAALALTLLQAAPATAVRTVTPPTAAARGHAPLTAPDVASAQLTARVRNRPVEVLSERSESSSTWVNPDGSFTTDTFAGRCGSGTARAGGARST